MTIRRTFSLALHVVETIEIVTDDDESPSLPPFPVVETTGTPVQDEIRPLCKCAPRKVSQFRKKAAR